MKISLRRFVFLGLLLVGVTCVSASRVYFRSAIANAASRPPELSPQMTRLADFYHGTWEYTESYPKSAQFPQGGENTGIYTSEFGPGGNSLLNRFHSNGPVGDFEGLLMMTWDPKESAYRTYVFGNDFPGCIVETGKFEGDTLTFRMEFSMGDKKIAIRNSAHLDEKGRMIVEEYNVGPDGQESLFLKVVATRKP